MFNAAEYIIKNCLEESKKKILLVCDGSTVNIVSYFQKAADSMGKVACVIQCDSGMRRGSEPEACVIEKMLESDAVICLTLYSMAHTAFRKRAEEKGIPFLSMPAYDEAVLNNDALMADYKGAYRIVDIYARILSAGNHVVVKNKAGTELYLDISGRMGNCCPGMTDASHLLGSPPDIEANISPIETYTNGVLVVDVSITDPRIGLLNKPVVLHVKHGAIQKIESEDKKFEKVIKEIFKEVGSDRAYVVGELGIGFNDRAKPCGNMLVDEGAKGYVHFGIGSNWTIGGTNQVDFHLDFIIGKATVVIDGKKVIERGVILYE